MEDLHLEVEAAGLQRLPKTTVTLEGEALKKVLKFIDVLEDDDDVQKVYHNLELNDEVLAALE
jgi:transcriptional/translational regulatory protein YebC/TACO1